MTSIATKLGAGTAGCAIAVAASLTSVAPAQAAPVAAPAAPVVFGQVDVPLAPVVAPASPVLRGPADVPQGTCWFGILCNDTDSTVNTSSGSWGFGHIFEFIHALWAKIVFFLGYHFHS
jgi:hypothetical protein